MIKDVLTTLKNDEEALLLLSGLGFSFKDWPFIEKLGAYNLIQSELMTNYLIDYVERTKGLKKALFGLRGWLDAFYEHGSLLTPAHQEASRLFVHGHAPLVFFYQGQKKIIESPPMVAVVGSRRASLDAINITKKLTQILVAHHITVVSGGAMGIDSAAHKGALSHHGQTIMVVGQVCDRKPHDQIVGLLKLYPFGPLTPQGKYMFVERNRYVVSLADAVVIVQGQAGSGTLHTARFAHHHKVPLYVIPGPLDDPRSYVGNYLLHKQKAIILTDFNKFAEQLGSSRGNSSLDCAEVADKKTITKPDLPYLLHLISQHENSLTLDELLALTGKPLLDLQKELLGFELSGQLIKQGGQFVLTAG